MLDLHGVTVFDGAFGTNTIVIVITEHKKADIYWRLVSYKMNTGLVVLAIFGVVNMDDKTSLKGNFFERWISELSIDIHYGVLG